MPLTTASDYIHLAYGTCGQMRAGYKLPPEMLDNGLSQWRLLFDSFNAKRSMQYTEPDYIFPVTGPGHGVTGNGQTFNGAGYQIGPTAVDFVTPARPEALNRVNVYMTTAPTPARVPISLVSFEEWLSIIAPIIPPINIGLIAAYDAQWPNGVLWVWPQMNGNSLEIFTWGALVPPATLSTPWTAPSGYGDLVVYQLAMRLWPFCTKDIMPERRSFQWVAGQAERIRQQVAAVNAPRPRMINDFRGGTYQNAGASDWALLLTGLS